MENMEEETNLINNINYDFDMELCKQSFEKCCEIIKDEKGNDIKIMYMDKFHNPVPKDEATIKLIKHLNDSEK